MFCPKLFALALYALPALAAPSPLLRISRAQNPLPGKYIVTLKQGQGTPDTISVESVSSNMSPASNITHQWENMGAFAGDLSADDLETLRADPRVEAIEEDGIMQTLASITQFVHFTSILSLPSPCTEICKPQSGPMHRGA
jgi:hypothetical protein